MHGRLATVRFPERLALVCCARVRLDQASREELLALLHRGLDLAALAREAKYHGLTPLLCRHLHAAASDACPAEFLATLRAATQQSVVTSLALAAELVAVLDALLSAGVPTLAIKGPVSATLCYGDFGLRTFSDIDLLVDAANVGAATKVLEARGYIPPFVLSPPWQARFVRTGTEQLFRHADGRRLVDLHWCLMPRGYSFTPGIDGVFARRQTVRVGTTEVPTLGIEPTLLFLLLHGMKHDWASLGWLCDVAELLRRHPSLDWDAVLGWSAASGPQRFIDVGLALAHSLLGAPVPRDALRRGETDEAVARIVAAIQQRMFASPRDEPALIERSAGLFYFRAMQRTSDRLHFLHDVVWRPTPLEWRAFPLPAALAPLHYFVRPVRLLWKHAGPGRFARHRAR
jgi:hypothetical protein